MVSFDFERIDAYKNAIEFVVVSNAHLLGAVLVARKRGHGNGPGPGNGTRWK